MCIGVEAERTECVDMCIGVEAERSECVDMCIGEAPPFGVGAKLVLSTTIFKTLRYRRVVK